MEIKEKAPCVEEGIYCACGERLRLSYNATKNRLEVYCQACVDAVSALNAQEPCATCKGSRVMWKLESGELRDKLSTPKNMLGIEVPCPSCQQGDLAKSLRQIAADLVHDGRETGYLLDFDDAQFLKQAAARLDALEKASKEIKVIEEGDVQRLIKQVVLLQAENKQLKEAMK